MVPRQTGKLKTRNVKGDWMGWVVMTVDCNISIHILLQLLSQNTSTSPTTENKLICISIHISQHPQPTQPNPIWITVCSRINLKVSTLQSFPKFPCWLYHTLRFCVHEMSTKKWFLSARFQRELSVADIVYEFYRNNTYVSIPGKLDKLHINVLLFSKFGEKVLKSNINMEQISNVFYSFLGLFPLNWRTTIY